MIQLPKILYLVAEAADGTRTYAQIGAEVSERIGRRLDADGVELLVEEKLRPLGVLAQADGSSPQLEKADPLLALKAKTAVVPEGVVTAIARVFRPFFLPVVVVAVLGTFVGLDVWLFVFHGVAQSVRTTLYDPLFVLLLLGLVALSAAFHECGHATACAYGGARPGAMGVGVYIVWPAFYTDVTDAYRLGKAGRLRTDLGGVYFNSIFTLATFAVYFATGWEPLLLVVPLQIMEMMHQFLPFIRLDGYYVVGDLTGVPDMFSRIRPTLRSLNPFKKSPREVTALRPWVRVVVTAYVFTVVPLLLFLLGLTLITAPRILATAWDSMLLQNIRLHRHVATGAYLHMVVDAIQMAVLTLPIAGLLATFSKLGRSTFRGAWKWTHGRWFARLVFVTATACAAAFCAYTMLPSGNYRAIAATDRATLGNAVTAYKKLPRHRPWSHARSGGGSYVPPSGGGGSAPGTTSTTSSTTPPATPTETSGTTTTTPATESTPTTTGTTTQAETGTSATTGTTETTATTTNATTATTATAPTDTTTTTTTTPTTTTTAPTDTTTTTTTTTTPAPAASTATTTPTDTTTTTTTTP